MARTGAKIRRTPLNLKGPFHQVHFDGHEKMNWQALDFGDDTGLSIYGGRCAWTGRIVVLQLTPNVRCQRTIAHIFLDFIENEDCGSYVPLPTLLPDSLLDYCTDPTPVIPFTAVTDKGSEVAEMLNIQNRFRQLAAPEHNCPERPASRQVKSVHNTPIEGLWRWHRASHGCEIEEYILAGKEAYNANNPIHQYAHYKY
jgi:hypothetical protein